MPAYKKHHYVPEWLQHRFLPDDLKEKKFYYLDLNPETVVSGKHTYIRKALLRWGPDSCFFEEDLYATKFGNWTSTEIEEKFFGKIDSSGVSAVEHFANFMDLGAGSHDAFEKLLPYMSTQKLRTPKGLIDLAHILGVVDKNNLLIKMQQLRTLYRALWTECIWSIADASQSETKFLLSDHPITVYNRACPPNSKWCLAYRDPDIALSGTHTIFPLSLNKILILTNLSWVRNPYGHPRHPRPNPNPFRDAMFNFLHIQVGRLLTETEVNEINFVIKKRAYRYIAAAKEEWLYPENKVPSPVWHDLGQGYLFMPDPRSVTFSSEVMIGYEKGRSDSFDAYGRKPWQKDYNDEALRKKEWETFLAFQGEFARVFGPKRRGCSNDFSKRNDKEDSPEFHGHNLELEKKYKPKEQYKYY